MTEQAFDPDVTLAQYAEGPARLETILVGLGDSHLDLALNLESWTIRQIIHHIADGDDLWKACIMAALGNSSGLFSLQWYWDKPQTEWAENWRYATRPVEPSLERLCANRRHIVELIQQSPDAWGKSIRIKWPRRKEDRITVRDVLEMQARHVCGHISDIQMIRHAYNL